MSQQYPMWQPPPPTPPSRAGGDRRRRLPRAALIAIVVVAIVVAAGVVALVNTNRGHHSDTAGSAATAHPSGSSAPGTGSQQPGQPAPTPSGGDRSGQNGEGSQGSQGSQGGQDPTLPKVACPTIRDEQSHLQYKCVDDYLTQDGADSNLGLRIELNHEVEPGWILSEGSGNPDSFTPPGNTVVDWRAEPVAVPTTAEVTAEVQRRTELALQLAYGAGPSARTLSKRTLTVSGATGYEQVTEITVNPAFRALMGLKVKTERLWVVGVPTKAGVSIFMMSIPDERSDLWPKAEATVATLRII